MSRDAVGVGFDRGTRMAGARFHPRLGQLRSCGIAVVGSAFVVVVAASCWLPMARADDRGADPQAAAELAVRKRILANWQARQDRIKSFYVAWKHGPGERTPRSSAASFPEGLVHNLWVASDGRFREERLSLILARRLVIGRHEKAFDGKHLRTHWTALIGSPDGTRGNLRVRWAHSGHISSLNGLSGRPWQISDVAETLAFRPLQSPFGDWTLENSRVTSQNAVVGRGHYVKIEKSDARARITEACWVDPRRDDLVIHFQREFGTGSEEWISLEYKQDPRHGWVPTSWQREIRDTTELGTRRAMRSLTEEAVVTECKINDDFLPGTFQIRFPAGVIVHDEASKRH